MATPVLTALQISSPAFEPGAMIPGKYTCDGRNINPPLQIGEIPTGTQTLALIFDDPDAPRGTWDHWIVWNIPPVAEIAEDSIPGTEGINSFRRHAYGGPCPPSGTHRYFFKVFALDKKLDLPPDAGKYELEKAMKGHILARGQLMGTYRRKG